MGNICRSKQIPVGQKEVLLPVTDMQTKEPEPERKFQTGDVIVQTRYIQAFFDSQLDSMRPKVTPLGDSEGAYQIEISSSLFRAEDVQLFLDNNIITQKEDKLNLKLSS